MDERHEPPTKKVKMPIRKDKPAGSSSSRPKPPKPAVTSSKKKAKAAKPRKSSPLDDNAERRRSGRSHKVSKYTERDSSEDDEEMLDGVAEWDYYDRQGKSVTPDPKDDDESGKETGGGSDEASELSEAPDSEEEKPKKTAAKKSKAKTPVKAAKGRGAKKVKKVYDMDLDDDDE
jgi:sister-chromatid-cohesion protein PDS5